MRNQEGKIEVVKKVHLRICLRDITFLAARPSSGFLPTTCLLVFLLLRFYLEKNIFCSKRWCWWWWVEWGWGDLVGVPLWPFSLHGPVRTSQQMFPWEFSRTCKTVSTAVSVAFPSSYFHFNMCKMFEK